jgi:hypothetical protein
MKRNLLLILVLFLFCGASFGLSLSDLGNNITINDSIYSNITQNSAGSTNPTGIGNENNETEKGTIANQDWDLEAIFWNYSTKNLYIIGGFNYLSGVNGYNVNMGDIFIGGVVLDLTREPNNTSGNREHLKTGGTYNIVSGNFSTLVTTDVPASGPYAYNAGGMIDTKQNYTYSVETITDQGIIGSFTSWPGYSNNHYALIINASDSVATLINSGSLIRTTFSCGNDLITGKAAPVPEPATMLLLGTGLVGLAGFGRKKFKK